MNTQLYQDIILLTKSVTPENVIEIIPIQQSGSDRNYFRIILENRTLIATQSNNIKENEAFIYFATHFKNKALAVPQVLAIQDSKTLYLQEDLGGVSLLDILEKEGKTKGVYQLYQKTIQALIQLQIKGDTQLEYDRCLTNKVFGKQAILADLLYFKYYFLDTLKYPYDKHLLIEEFEEFAALITTKEFQYFLFRDFQSRNIIIQNNQPFFIDFQGGMKGALQYDLASLLWQAKANLPTTWKNDLLQFYIQEVSKVLPYSIDEAKFKQDYDGYILIRLLQVLGAYGFRGLFERKAHFLISIPLALKNLKEFLENVSLCNQFPIFLNILKFITSEDLMNRFTFTQASSTSPLVVEINSFSYKNGYPQTNPLHGGGFVFDMRGIFNPGRIDSLKHFNGQDKEIQQFIEQQTSMHDYLFSAWDIIDSTVDTYLKRHFEYLQINFGCTGGQHRSVYAAEQTARHLRNKYKVNVILKHTNQANWQLK
ncbi:MAG: RNase adapter RapZ [Alphaproteobacteria bacterium]|nr:RNase adapter RapZ [Alphaproteobacteria bacterium]